MADALVSSIIRVIFGNLNSALVQQIGLAWGLKEELRKLESILSTIQAVIHDAEEQQTKSEAVMNWLTKLKVAAYDADDVLDEFSTEALLRRPEISGGIIKQVSDFFSHRNPLLFRFKMSHKIKKVVENLDAIAGERAKFHFREGVVMDTENIADFERRVTSSFLTEQKVYGRDVEKENIIQMLRADESRAEDVSIYAIFGMGGLGKTTLAQFVYNDERVHEQFQLRIWVCVSEDFGIKRLTRAIIESAGRTVSDISELDPMQSRLREILNGKRFLLVLDDVWNEDQEEWDKLKSVLRYGARGSSIIVTTRSEKVALIMATLPTYPLGLLSDDDSWSLFSKRAFGSEGREEDSKLEMIGRDILKKCGGVPLAIKALSGLLRFKIKESEWLAIKDSEIWDLPDDKSGVLPSLKLSYKHLPSHLRQCFAFCSIFPKDHGIPKEDLVQLWMANGFIPSKGQMDLEDIGYEMFDDLLWRSFFQEPQKDQFGNIWRCKMHDLMHDLAQSIMRNECMIVENDSTQKIPNGVRHLSHNAGNLGTFPQNVYDLNEFQSLLSFLIFSDNYLLRFYNISIDDLRNNTSLRMLVFPFGYINKELIFLYKFKHLRYLDLCYSDIKILPESICCLQNLQTLKLNNCSALRKLPNDMRHMSNLRHLGIQGCDSLAHMPTRMGQLTGLRILSTFIVGEDMGQQIGQLKDLNKLCGRIEIKDLDNVKSSTEAMKANLMSKSNLESLGLQWRAMVGAREQGNVEKVAESLQPHPNLKKLFVRGYPGSKFPPWMRDMLQLPNLVQISLQDCGRCEYLPSLGRLPFLRSLTIEGMDVVKGFLENDELVGDDTAKAFPSLKYLRLYNMPNLEGWMRVEGREIFPCLEYLEIENCYKMEGLPQLQVLGRLSISGDNMLLTSEVKKLTSLTSLYIQSSHGFETLPEELLGGHSLLKDLKIYSMPHLKYLSSGLDNLTSLEILNICNCNKLTCLPEGIQNLTRLKLLNITNCGIVSLPMVWLSSLTKLWIHRCNELKSLSEEVRCLTMLKDLQITGCQKLTCLPEGIQYLSSLQILRIDLYSNELLGLPEWLGNLTCLSSLSIGGFHNMRSLPEGMQHLVSLEYLQINNCMGLLSLPEWLGNLTSLSSLSIWGCDNIRSLPEQLQLLTTLKKLYIGGSKRLKKRCKKGSGKDWPKIAHIPCIRIEDGQLDTDCFNYLLYNCINSLD